MADTSIFAPGLTPGAIPLEATRRAAPGEAPINVALRQGDPTTGEVELAQRIRELFGRARAERQRTTQQWERNYKILRNRSWINPTNGPLIPEIRSIVGARVGWITDQRPKFELTPAAQPFTPFWDYYSQLAEDMKIAVNAAWQTYAWESVIETVAWDADAYDVGYFKVTWNNALCYGMGDVHLQRVDPWSLYVDPGARDFESANYIIEARTISLQELDRRFPGAVKKFDLQGFRENLDVPPDPRRIGQMPMANPGAVSPATVPRYGLPGQGRRDHISRDDTGVTLLEAWMREHYEENGRVYDGWRCIAVAGNNVLMNKRAIELLPHNCHPFTEYRPENLGDRYGVSIVELLTPMQHAINRTLGSIQLNIDLVGNPPFYEDARAGISRTMITNRPGQRIQKNSGAEIGWMDIPQMPAEASNLVRFYIEQMQKDSGLSAVQRGIVPGGRNSTDVLDTVMEAGFVRIRLAVRNLEFALRNVGQQLVAMIGEFYTEPRLASVVGPSQQISTALHARHFYVPSQDGQAPLRFQTTIYVGSMLPTSREARKAEADQLYAMGAIDRPAVLEAHEWPGWRKVNERINEMEAKGTFAPPGARSRAQRAG